MNKFLAGTAWIVLVGAVSYHFVSQSPRPMAAKDGQAEIDKHIGRAIHGTLPTIIEPDFQKTVTVKLPPTRNEDCYLRSKERLRAIKRSHRVNKKVAAHSVKHHKHKAGAHHKHHPKPKHHGGHHHHGGHGAHPGGHTGGHHHHTPPPHPRC